MSDINEKSNFVFEFQPVTKLFEEQVRLHPDKCAVASSKESFTYAQLNERANRIANSLIEKGVGCEKIVGVVLERCCDFYAVRQGILKAGGAFAVAAPDYPDDRVQFIFEDAGVPFIITTKEIAKAAKDQLKLDIDKKKIQMKDPIKAVGTTSVAIKLHPKVTAELKVVVEGI